MKKQPLLIIDHCEPELSEWLFLEYKHAAQLWDDTIIFTRVVDNKTTRLLKKIGIVIKEASNEKFSDNKCIILDPQAKKPLTTKDCSDSDAIVIGGLLGYEKPKGRTKKLICENSDFETRNLGKLQLSIDGAVFVTKSICQGHNLRDIEIARAIEIIHDSVHSTILPFGYPIIDDKPIITPGLIKYLTNK